MGGDARSSPAGRPRPARRPGPGGRPAPGVTVDQPVAGSPHPAGAVDQLGHQGPVPGVEQLLASRSATTTLARAPASTAIRASTARRRARRPGAGPSRSAVRVMTRAARRVGAGLPAPSRGPPWALPSGWTATSCSPRRRCRRRRPSRLPGGRRRGRRRPPGGQHEQPPAPPGRPGPAQPDDPVQLDGGAAPVEVQVGRLDLVRVGRRSRLGLAGTQAAGQAVDQHGGAPGRPGGRATRAAVSSGPMATASQR